MNDIRFLLVQQFHHLPRIDDLARMEEFASQALSDKDIRSYLKTWWDQTYTRQADVQFTISSLGDESGNSTYVEFIEQFGEFLSEDKIQVDDKFRPIAFTVGAFLASTINEVIELDEFLLAADTVAKVYDAKIFFYQKLLDRLKLNEKNLEHCLSIFKKIPQKSNELVEFQRFVEGEITGGEQRENRLKEANDLLSLWGSNRGHIQLKRTILRQVQFLIMLSPAALADILDALPFQGLREALLDDILATRDPDLILELLRTAPEAFSAEGTWNKHVSILNTIDMAFQYAKSLESAVAHIIRLSEISPGQSKHLAERAKNELPSLQEKELPNWLNSVADTVLKRTDGKFVLLHYLIHLLRTVRFAGRLHSDGNKGWPAEKVAAEIFIKKLSATSISTKEILSISKNMKGEGRGSSLMFVLGAANIEEDRLHLKDVSNELWAEYESLLLKMDSEVVSQANPSGKVDIWVFVTLGEILVGTEDVNSVFCKTFEKLYHQRFKMHFGYEYNLSASTRHLLEVGFGALQVLISAGTYALSIDLWRILTEKSWIRYFTSQEHNPNKREDVARCYAFLPFVCKTQPDMIETIISEHKDFFASDPHISIISAFFLSKNGVEAKQVCSFFNSAGIALQSELNSLEEWDTLTAREGKPSMNILEIKTGLGL